MEESLNTAPCVLLNFTNEGWITGVNRTTCEALKYSREALLQKNINEVVTLATRIFFQTHFFPLLRLHGHAEEIYITLLTNEGQELPVIISVATAAPLQYLAAGIVIVNRNKYESEIIAAKKYAEQALAENKELLQAKTQLQQHAAELDRQLVLLQQQNENLRQLSFSLTHTVQEPLRKIALFSSMFTEGSVANNEMLQKVSRLAVHIRQLFVQLQRYLHLGLEESEIETIHLTPLLHEVAKPVLEEGHRVQLVLSGSLSIQGQQALLLQLFQELLRNAVAFRKKGGIAQILIEAVVIKANSFRMLKENYRYTDLLKVSLADKGIGFPADQSEQVFGLFTKLDPTTTGYGMGLPLCKKIMELHQGYITAEAGENKGTVINCFFPMPQ